MAVSEQNDNLNKEPSEKILTVDIEERLDLDAECLRLLEKID